jgi:hypothetical protein
VVLGVLFGLALVSAAVWLTVRGQHLAAELEELNAQDRAPFEQTLANGMPDAMYLVAPDAVATASFSEGEVADALQRVVWASQQGRHSLTVGQTDLDDLLRLYAEDQREELAAAMGTVDALDFVTVVDATLVAGVKAEDVAFAFDEVTVDGRPVLEVSTTIFWAYAFEGSRVEHAMAHTVFLEHRAVWRVDASDVDAGVRLVDSAVTLANPDCAAAQNGVLAALPYEAWEDGEFPVGDCRQ